MKLELDLPELDRLLTFWEDNMLTSNRLNAIEATQADHETRLAAVETTLAALPPSTDFGPQITALQAETADLREVIDAVEA